MDLELDWNCFFAELYGFGTHGMRIATVTQRIHGTGIFTYIWLMFMVNVGIYTSPMDPLGNKCTSLVGRFA